MCLPDVILARLREVMRDYHVSDDRTVPSLTDLVSIFYCKVFYYMSWGNLDDFDKLVLHDEHLACEEVNFEDHLVRDTMDIVRVQIQRPIKYPLTKRFNLCALIQRIFVVFKCRYISMRLPLTK
jgi:hypothetical protein